MDHLAQRILKEQVTPKLEKMLDGDGLSEKEFEWTKDLICTAKELLEIDCLLKKFSL